MDTLLGVDTIHSLVCRVDSIVISDRYCPCYLMVLDMLLFDIILGMDWLSISSPIIDCERRRVTLFPKPNVSFRFLANI